MKRKKSAIWIVCIFSFFSVALSNAQDRPDLEEIIIVFKTHVDMGYTDLARDVIKKYQTGTIDKALEVVDENRNMPAHQQFVWTLPGWPMTKIMENWPGQTPERLNRVRNAFEDGHFVTHALPFTMHTEMLFPECLVRGLGYSSGLSRDFSKPLPTGAKMTDVPSHSWIIPTLLKHAGINFLHLGCNGASTPPELPYLFWWEGPDASRLLTMYSTEYGSELTPPAGWPHKTWLAMLMRYDNQGPPQPEELMQVLDEIQKRLPDVKVTVGELGDFGDRIMKENPTLPVIKQDMPDTWIHGMMCDPASAIQASKTMPSLFTGESLHTLLGLYGVPGQNKEQTIREAYENSLMYYEHTWGRSMGSVSGYVGVKDYIGQTANLHYGEQWKKDLADGRFDNLVESWEEHSTYAANAYNLIMSLLDEDMQRLANSVDLSGERTVVYNALPWERDGVPAMGYKSFPGNDNPVPGKQPKIDKDAGTLENKYFSIELNPESGSIRSVIDKQSGRELVDKNALHGFGQFLYERFSRNEVVSYCKSYVRNDHVWGFVEIGKPDMPSPEEYPYQSFTPLGCNLENYHKEDGIGLTMTYVPGKGGLSYPVSTSVILYGDASYFDLEVTVDKPADPWPEAGWICFPFKVNTPAFRVGRNGSIVDPVQDFALPGVNRHLFAVGTGVAIFDNNKAGVGVCGMNTPLVSLSEPGCWKFDNSFIPSSPSVYYNLFNNNWSTNFRFWNEGKWVYRFRVWAYDHYDAVNSLIVPSVEARYPLQYATGTKSGGKLPKGKRGIELSRKGVLVTAFGSDPDGSDGVLLRLWEQAGISGKLTVRFPKEMKFTQAVPVNLRGEVKGEAVPVRSGKIDFELGAYVPASFILK